MRRRADAPPGVFEEDPIDAPRPEAGSRIAVARPLEGVKSVRVYCVLVSGGEVSVHETPFHEVAVRGAAGTAVEVPCDDGRRSALQELRQLAEDQAAAIHAGESAYVIQVCVQVQEGKAGLQDPETRPV